MAHLKTAATGIPIFCADCKEYICTDYDHGVHDTLYPEHATSVHRPSFSDDCPHHPGNPFKFYCPQHELLCCVECKDKFHSKCNVMEITQVNAKKARKDLQKTIERIEKGLDEIKRGSSIASKCEEFEQSFSRAKSDITSAFDAVRTALNAREKELLDDLDAIHKEISNPTIEKRIQGIPRTEKTLSEGTKFLQKPWTESMKKELIMRLCNVKNEETVFLPLEDYIKSLPNITFQYDEDFIEDYIEDFGSFSVSRWIKVESVTIGNISSKGFTVSLAPPLTTDDNIEVHYEAELSPGNKNSFKLIYDGEDPVFTVKDLLDNTSYDVRIRTVSDKNNRKIPNHWSDIINTRTSIKWTCKWKDCPESVDQDKKYTISDPGKQRVITKLANGGWCTAIGDSPLPTSETSHWEIKFLGRSSDGLFVGVAPFDIDQNNNKNINNCGWYLDCYYLTLWSGFPHFAYHNQYGPKESVEKYIHRGDIFGVNFKIPGGELSFVVNGMDLGVAFKDIPLDRPLVPCVLLRWKDDSAEFTFN